MIHQQHVVFHNGPNNREEADIAYSGDTPPDILKVQRAVPVTDAAGNATRVALQTGTYLLSPLGEYLYVWQGWDK